VQLELGWEQAHPLRKKMVQASRHQFWAENLDAHGHDDVAIAVLVVGKGTQLTG
jgi:hypothetical protein